MSTLGDGVKTMLLLIVLGSVNWLKNSFGGYFGNYMLKDLNIL